MHHARAPLRFFWTMHPKVISYFGVATTCKHVSWIAEVADEEAIQIGMSIISAFGGPSPDYWTKRQGSSTKHEAHSAALIRPHPPYHALCQTSRLLYWRRTPHRGRPGFVEGARQSFVRKSQITTQARHRVDAPRELGCVLISRLNVSPTLPLTGVIRASTPFILHETILKLPVPITGLIEPGSAFRRTSQRLCLLANTFRSMLIYIDLHWLLIALTMSTRRNRLAADSPPLTSRVFIVVEFSTCDLCPVYRDETSFAFGKPIRRGLLPPSRQVLASSLSLASSIGLHWEYKATHARVADSIRGNTVRGLHKTHLRASHGLRHLSN